MERKKKSLLRRPLPPSDNYYSLENRQKQKHEPIENKSLQSVVAGESHFIDLNDFYIFPLNPKGPAPLPMGKVLRTPIIKPATVKSSEFTFNDFLATSDDCNSKNLITSGPMISRENYLKMTSWFAKNSPQQTDVHVSELQSKLNH